MRLKTQAELMIGASRGGKATAGRITKVRAEDGDAGESLTDSQIASLLGVPMDIAVPAITYVRRRALRANVPILWQALHAGVAV